MKIKSTIIWILTLAMVGCLNPKQAEQSCAKMLLHNQHAYQTNAIKRALFRGEGSIYKFIDKDGAEVLKGRIWQPVYWEQSGDSVSIIDFSELNTVGEYSVLIDDKLLCATIVIADDAYSEVSKAALKAFYYNRTAMPLTEEYAGQWSRLAGHPDTIVYIHKSAASPSRSEGSIISSTGGWYDAGDYNKYIVNSGITTFTLLKAYAMAPQYHKKLHVNIPESGNILPDILSEALYNLKWMQTMQDESDGGVYHKLTTKKFEDFVMPHEATNKRYVVQKSTSAALDFAATMSSAQRIYKEFDSYNKLSNDMLIQAENAWDWAIKNPSIFYEQPSDISTGAYSDTSLVDEWFWAASELYISTGNKKYLKVLDENIESLNTPKWDVVNMLGVISLITSDKAGEFESLKENYLSYVNSLLRIQKDAPYLISMEKYEWGSNSDVANQAMLKLIVYKITNDAKYLEAAREDYNYIMGRNATGYCFVSGFGTITPLFIHHRPSGADAIDLPVPGFLIGGPNTIVLNDCGDEVDRSSFPALSYIDMECSYSTNEIAINWNAPLVFTTSTLDAYDIK